MCKRCRKLSRFVRTRDTRTRNCFQALPTASQKITHRHKFEFIQAYWLVLLKSRSIIGFASPFMSPAVCHNVFCSQFFGRDFAFAQLTKIDSWRQANFVSRYMNYYFFSISTYKCMCDVKLQRKPLSGCDGYENRLIKILLDT